MKSLTDYHLLKNKPEPEISIPNSIKSKFGIVEFIDCITGLDQFQPNEFDLCFTGVPYLVGLDLTVHRDCSKNYPIEGYETNLSSNDFFTVWWNKVIRCCNMVIIQCGHDFVCDWIKNLKLPSQKFIDLFYWVNFSKSTGARSGDHSNTEVFLCYNTRQLPQLMPNVWNDPNQPTRMPKDTIKYNYSKLDYSKDEIIHPCPFPRHIVKHFFKYLKPKKVLDTFGGSGTVFEVCSEMGIEFHGFETEKKYYHDNDLRINNGINEHQRLLQFPDCHIGSKCIKQKYTIIKNTKKSYIKVLNKPIRYPNQCEKYCRYINGHYKCIKPKYNLVLEKCFKNKKN